MHGTDDDDKDLGQTPEAAAGPDATVAANAAHLARLLSGATYPDESAEERSRPAGPDSAPRSCR